MISFGFFAWSAWGWDVVVATLGECAEYARRGESADVVALIDPEEVLAEVVPGWFRIAVTGHSLHEQW